jgi:hypothetical protein
VPIESPLPVEVERDLHTLRTVMETVFEFLDPYFIQLYRLSGYTFVDFLFGTFVLALTAVIVGELTISVVFLLSYRRIDTINAEVVRYQKLAADALSAEDNEAYAAANKLANDAFGKSFFQQFGLSAAFLWPVFFALAWMQTRFVDVEFPLLFSDVSLGFIGVFIALYAAAYLIIKKTKHRLPYFRRIKAILDSYDRPGPGTEEAEESRHGAREQYRASWCRSTPER